MSRYGMGLIVVTALVMAAAAAHSGLSGNMPVDSTKSAVPEFSDEERGRIFDGVMRISDAPVTDMAAPKSPTLCRRSSQCRSFPPTSSTRFRWFADINL